MPAADSDDEYIQTISDEEGDAHRVSNGRRHGDRSAGTRGRSARAAGFEVSRTWEALEEGVDGTISGAVEGLLDVTKRKR